MCAVTTPSSKGAGTASKALPGRQPQPATLIIFGAGGDLTKRLVVPALYHLVQAGKLPDQFAVVGVDRNDQATAQWRQNLTNIIQTLTPAGEIAAPAWSWLTDRMHYMPADFTQSETFRHLERPLQGALRTLFTSVQASFFRGAFWNSWTRQFLLAGRSLPEQPVCRMAFLPPG
jgi:glucose-6-phosphate 1-dehydrogenase